MRKVIASTFLSLDGVMQAPGGPSEDPTGGFRFGGWFTSYFDELLGQAVDKVMADPFDLLLGRKTYEIFAAHWPFIDPDAEYSEITRKFAACRKYVAASPDQPLTWQNSVNLGSNPVSAVERLKREDGPNLLIQGSGQFAQALLAADLIDEITVMVAPVLLGKGKRLFGESTAPTGLELVDHAVSTTGVTIGRYRRGGEIQTGSFAMPEPSQAERDRQARWAREG